MPARNDAAAVRAAAKAVDRDALGAVLRGLLAARLPKRKAERALLPTVGQQHGRWVAGEGYVKERWNGEAWERQTRPEPSPTPSRRRKATRTDYATRQRVVEERPFGRWPRYGTARYAKAQVVRSAIKEDRTTRVKDLLGLRYEWEGKSGAITFHDLEVMEEKRLITIKQEGE